MLGVVLVNLFVGVLVGASVRQSLLQYEEAAATTSRNLARTTEQYVADLIEKIDYLLFDTVDTVEAQLREGGIAVPSTDRFITERQGMLGMLEAIRVADDQGLAILGTAPSSTVPRTLTDRDYFIQQRERPGTGLYISDSHVSKVTGRWSIFLSRRINRPDGSFFGIAYAVIPLDRVEEHFARIDVGGRGGISLRDERMGILARHPDPKGAARGNGNVSPEMERFMQSGASAATFFSPRTWDGTARMVSVNKIGRFPLYIAVGMAEDDYLALWRADLHRFVALYTMFVLATLTWAFVFHRTWRQRIHAEQEARQTLEARVVQKTASLREYAEALERSNADLEQFAYVASHDLREPLRMVSSYIGLLERRYGQLLDQDGHDFIGFAKEGAVRMDRLVQDLLEFSRVGRNTSAPTATPLRPILQDVLRVLDRPIAEAEANIVLPDAPPEIVCFADELFQVLQNLISNALKFRAPGRAPEIRIGVERGAGCWQFSVADNGIGIDPAYFSRIFMIFQRLHTRQQYEGTGIGLAICKKIVERHGGTIWVESAPGDGATFRFTIPDAGSAPTRAAKKTA
jgi:signal transduction histidine kinase